MDPASIIEQSQPIFFCIANFIAQTTQSPILIVENNSHIFSKKIISFITENFGSNDVFMGSPKESPLFRVVNKAVEASNKDLSFKIHTFSQQVTSLQLAIQDIFFKSLRTNLTNSTPNPNPPSKPSKPSGAVICTTNPVPTSYVSAAKSFPVKPASKKNGSFRPNSPLAHIEEVPTNSNNEEFFSMSYKKTKNVRYFESSQSVFSKYTQICIFPSTKLQWGIDDISSKIISINKCLPLDKVPKNFFYIMGCITAQKNLVFYFPSSFSFELILGFKNLIFNALSLPLSTPISSVTSEQGYYISGISINHSLIGTPLSEANLLAKLKLNNPDVLFTKVKILSSNPNSRFKGSQLISANVFVFSKDAAKADNIIFNNLSFLLFHTSCHVMHKHEKKKFIFCSKCFKIGQHETSKCKLKSALCKLCINPSGSSAQHNAHYILCISEGNLGFFCFHPPTCCNCLGHHAFDFPLYPEWSKFKLYRNYLSRF